jgi:hypothetical protein
VYEQIIGRVERIDRETAKALLGNMVKNRHVRLGKVEQFRQDMQGGRFEVNGQGLIVSDQGRLMDGQNRLHAFLETDLEEFWIMVTRGVSEDVFDTLDSGAVRTVGDVLAIRGIKNSSGVGAVARAAFNYVAGGATNRTPSKVAIADFCGAHPHVEQAGVWAKQVAHYFRPSPVGAVLFLATEADHKYRDAAHDFAKGVADGVGLEVGDPRHTLRKWAHHHDHAGHLASLEVACVAAARAWNAWAARRSINTLRDLSDFTAGGCPIMGFSMAAFPDVQPIKPSRGRPLRRDPTAPEGQLPDEPTAHPGG